MADSSTPEAECDNEQCRKKPRLDAQSEDSPVSQKPQPVGNDSKDETTVVTEKDIGITEYISSHEGFSGVIKQRFSDFLVNEIRLDGTVVRLLDLSEPQCDQVEEPDFTNVLKEDWIQKLDDLQKATDKEGEIFFEASNDKQTRSLVHQAIKVKYPALDTTTQEKDGVKVIKVTFLKNKDRKARSSWPVGRGDFCQFVLYKENKDTMEAADLLGKFLRMKPGAFNYAGTKDRRAKTCQLLSVYRVEAAKLHGLNKRLQGVSLGDFSYCKEKLKLGDLKGNRFNIILRNVTGSSEQIQQGVKSLREIGFINYYGTQRFGTTSIPTHHVGRALLKGKWQEAVELILKPRHMGKDCIEKARTVWWETRDSKQALNKLGSRHCIEKHLLIGLSKHRENDLLSALNCIPRNTRLMYVHAYQSYIWNAVVSRRLQEFGLKSVEGDLVLREETLSDDTDKAMPLNSKDTSPEVVTADSATKYTIHDVVLPLPGHDVVYPQNSCKGWYEELLAEDGLDLGSFKNKVKDYSLPGGYRKVLVKPGNLTWNEITYNDVTLSLVLSDYERIKGVELDPPPTDGKFKALQLEFSLPSSAYATMAIREVLKCDTSAAYQTTLNVT